MVSRNRIPSGAWLPLRANYYMDPAIQAVGNQGELAYIRSLAVSKITDGHGFVHDANMAPVRRLMRRWDDLVGALFEHNLWVPDTNKAGIRIRSWEKHNGNQDHDEHVKELARLRAERSRANRKEQTVIDVSRVTVRPKRRREEREEVERTPSGSVRSTSASRAAPLGGEPAARPTTEDQNQAGTVEAEAARAEIRKTIAKARLTTAGAGRNVRLVPTKVDPIERNSDPEKLAAIAAEFEALRNGEPQ